MASKPKIPPIDEAGQARRILTAFSEFLTAAPGRRVLLAFEAGAWVVRLQETKQTGGGSLQDAAAQAANIVVLEGATS